MSGEPPSDAATLERCCRLVNIELHAVALQRRRLRSVEPEDKQFVMRWWTDLGFLMVALLRLRRVAGLVLDTTYASDNLRSALSAFDTTTPSLRVMRNVAEHADCYAIDSPTRHVKTIDRRQLEVGEWDGTTFRWLHEAEGTRHELNVDAALAAAESIYRTLRSAERAAVDEHAT
jgi:hypothetical protein